MIQADDAHWRQFFTLFPNFTSCEKLDMARYEAENDQMCFLCFTSFCVFVKLEKKKERVLYRVFYFTGPTPKSSKYKIMLEYLDWSRPKSLST